MFYDIKLSGIYLITHKPTGKYYLGQSISIFNRFQNHYSQLKKGTHSTKNFQLLWNNSQPEDWKFEIIQYISKDYVKKQSGLKGKAFEKLMTKVLLMAEKEQMSKYISDMCLNSDKKHFKK